MSTTLYKLLMSVLLAAVTLPHTLQEGSISGTVVDPDGASLPGVTVTLQLESRSQVTYSDRRGAFEFTGLAFGTHSLLLELPGFCTDSRSVTISQDAPAAELAIALPLGPIQIAHFIRYPVAEAVRLADAVAHIRVVAAHAEEIGACEAPSTEVEAEVIELIKGGHAEWPGDTRVRFVERLALPRSVRLAEGAGRPQFDAVEVGEQYIAFFRWDERSGDFVPFSGKHFLFPVRSGRVDGTDPAQTVEEFTARLRFMMSGGDSRRHLPRSSRSN